MDKRLIGCNHASNFGKGIINSLPITLVWFLNISINRKLRSEYRTCRQYIEIQLWLLLPLRRRLASSAHAGSTDPLIEGAKLCTKQLPQYEKQNGIPAHLLSAIAATESGRYHQDLKIRIPWPWTINAAGRGYYFESKQEAIAAVKKLRKQGVQSIDVGCMQVNLHHHPGSV
jgi:hypothetical protein